jgi:hypothetical protein
MGHMFMVGYVAWLGIGFSLVGAAVAAGTAATAATAATTATAKAATGTARAVPARAAHTGGCWPELAPLGACCYKIVMAYMLVVML